MFLQIKTTVTDTATQYYKDFQNSCVVKKVYAGAEGMLAITEVLAEATLPTDGNSEEDMKELEAVDEDSTKGALVRVKNLRKMVSRRGRRKLMSYRPVKFSVDTVCCRF